MTNGFIPTEKVMMALLGKGMIYELENMEMEYEMSIPLDMFTISEEPPTTKMMDIKIKMSVGKCTVEILKDNL